MDKEQLRKWRQEAYQKAKARREADPRYQELKERAKEQRRAQYRAYKDAKMQKKLEAKRKKIAEKDAALMLLIKRASELEKQ